MRSPSPGGIEPVPRRIAIACSVKDTAADCDADAGTCNQLANLSHDDGWQLSRSCLASVAVTTVGWDKDGRGAVGRWLLTKAPGAGWVVTGAEVGLTVAGCR